MTMRQVVVDIVFSGFRNNDLRVHKLCKPCADAN